MCFNQVFTNPAQGQMDWRGANLQIPQAQGASLGNAMNAGFGGQNIQMLLQQLQGVNPTQQQGVQQ